MFLYFTISLQYGCQFELGLFTVFLWISEGKIIINLNWRIQVRPGRRSCRITVELRLRRRGGTCRGVRERTRVTRCTHSHSHARTHPHISPHRTVLDAIVTYYLFPRPPLPPVITSVSVLIHGRPHEPPPVVCTTTCQNLVSAHGLARSLRKFSVSVYSTFLTLL